MQDLATFYLNRYLIKVEDFFTTTTFLKNVANLTEYLLLISSPTKNRTWIRGLENHGSIRWTMGPYLKDDEWLYQESGVRITTTLHTPLESYLVCTLTTRLSTSIILRFVSSFVVGAGIEPARTQCPLDFKSNVSTYSTTRPKVLTNKLKNILVLPRGIEPRFYGWKP